MDAVMVQYTVRPEFAETNRANIRRVMERLRVRPIEGMYYSAHVLEDGRSFVHFNVAEDRDTLEKLQELEEFREFRAALLASDPPVPPRPTKLDPVAAGFLV